MSYGNLISIRGIVTKAYPMCQCSVVHDEATGITYDPERLGEAILRHAEAMHAEYEDLYTDAARIVLNDLKEQARLIKFVAGDVFGGPVTMLQHDRSDATYDSVLAWVESFEHRLLGPISVAAQEGA